MTRQEATKRWYAKLNAAHILMTGRALTATYKRYMENIGAEGVCRQSDGKLYVEDPKSIGLRFVGNVEAGSYGSRTKTWATRDTCGWYTDPDGYHSDDGDGLIWGVVYQLPSKRHTCRFVAGWQLGGYNEGPVLDLSRIYETPDEPYNERTSQENSAALEASKYADIMARDIAEDERQCQWEEREKEKDEEDDEAA